MAHVNAPTEVIKQIENLIPDEFRQFVRASADGLVAVIDPHLPGDQKQQVNDLLGPGGTSVIATQKERGIFSAPALAANGDGSLDLVAAAKGNLLWHIQHNGTAWPERWEQAAPGLATHL